MFRGHALLNKYVAVVLAVATLALPTGCSREKPPASLSLMYNAEEQPAEKSVVAQVLQSQLRDKGIEIRLDPVPNTIYNDRVSKGDFEAALTLWYLDYNDPEGFLTDFHSKAGYRLSRYSSPDYDKVYLGGLLAPGDEEKMRSYRQAVDRLNSELPWVPLFSNSEVFLMKPEAGAFVSNAYQYYDYRKVKLEHIRVASDVEVQTLDPAQAYDLASKHLVTQSYEGLVALDGDSRIVSALAESWAFSSNKDRLTFNLRKGVKFHPATFFTNGATREMTGQDVKASFERLIRSNSPYTYIFDYVEGVDAFKSGKAKDVRGFRAVTPNTFEIAMTRPFPTMLPWLLAPAAFVLPKELPEKYDFSRGSAGTGPFALRGWDGVLARFEANAEYRMPGQPVAKSLTLRVIKDSNTLTAAFRGGELDILNVPVSYFAQVFKDDGVLKPEWKGYEVRDVKLNNLKFVAFNMEKAPWGKDPGLRQKFAAAINRDAIVQHLLRNKGRSAPSVIPSGMQGF